MPVSCCDKSLFGLTMGPEVGRARINKSNRIDPVHELTQALVHIGEVLRTTTLSTEDIEVMVGEEDDLRILKLVASAQRNLRAAVGMLRPLVQQHARPSRVGRTGDLGIQAVSRAMALAWRELVGSLPAKDNTSFHGLLSAAVVTLFGELPEEPNWEAATHTARRRIEAT